MKGNRLTTLIAIIGTNLILLPVVIPLIFGFVNLFRTGQFLFDWLMPAELMPVVLAGAALLIWAAFRAKLYRRLITITFVGSLLLVVIGLVFAQASGLAQSAEGSLGWHEALLTGIILLFDLGVLITGIGGVLLLRAVMRR